MREGEIRRREVSIGPVDRIDVVGKVSMSREEEAEDVRLGDAMDVEARDSAGERSERRGFQAAGNEEGKVAEGLGTSNAEQEEWWSDDEDEFDSDDELSAAMDWVDMCEDMAARGGTGSNSSTGRTLNTVRPNAHGGVANKSAMQPKSKQTQKLESRMNPCYLPKRPLDTESNVGSFSSKVANSVRKNERREDAMRIRVTEKSDRATVEQAIDPRTRMVLFKMLNRGVFDQIHGCVSTGKEANVYHGVTKQGEDLAIKIYKTSILVFKDRDRYVSGDFRFRNGYGKGNPRKMVKTWAEKEMRNLNRLRAVGINAPKPILLRMHVLVMEFFGMDGWAAPRLKDANLPNSKLSALYRDLIQDMRMMFQKCRLVHADLSEYNILYHEGKLAIIDVSQSVDLDHPHALDFLREDCTHVNDFFRKSGVATLTVRELFDFCTDPTIKDEQVGEYLDRMREIVANRPTMKSTEEEVEENVFKKAYIPRRMEDIPKYERDAVRMKTGENSEHIYYQTIMGMKEDGTGVQLTPKILEQEGASVANEIQDSPSRAANDHVPEPEEDTGATSLDGTGDSDSETEESEGDQGERVPRQARDKQAEKEDRKAHKKAVKESNRERRKTKTPKYEKKKRKKAGHSKNKK